jgi:hypothetical protein
MPAPVAGSSIEPTGPRAEEGSAGLSRLAHRAMEEVKLPGYDPQQTYRDAVNENLLRNDLIAGRMQNGYSPRGSGWGCLGAIVALSAVLWFIGIITHLALFIAHLAEHLVHLLEW